MSSIESTGTADSSKEDGLHEEETVTVSKSATAIDVDGLELVSSDGTVAVHGIDMAIPEGEFFGFLGPIRPGKTTTIKVFATLLSPTGGAVRVNGFDVRSEARKITYPCQELLVPMDGGRGS